MLSGILEKSTCADCKFCCAFDRYDVWEMPILDGETAEKALNINPDIPLIKKDNGYTFRVTDLQGDELFYCPLLDHGKGCILGDHKPFECRIWPYRIMNLSGRRAITIAPICNAMYHKPLSELMQFLKDGLAQKIFSYADEFPDIVKPYDNLYPVLMIENDAYKGR